MYLMYKPVALVCRPTTFFTKGRRQASMFSCRAYSSAISSGRNVCVKRKPLCRKSKCSRFT